MLYVIILCIIGAICLFAFLVKLYMYPKATVVGNSMLPTYSEGQVLLCRRVILKRSHNIEEGGVYVFKAPYKDDNYLIVKRVSFVIESEDRGREVYLLGDNPRESYDSRNYGLVPFNYVIAKVLRGV